MRVDGIVAPIGAGLRVPRALPVGLHRESCLACLKVTRANGVERVGRDTGCDEHKLAQW